MENSLNVVVSSMGHCGPAKMRRCVLIAAACVTVSAMASAALAVPVGYNAATSLYTQNFDTLASAGSGLPWTNGTTVTGWHAVNESGASHTVYSATSGAANQGILQSLGIAGTNAVGDRALGAQNTDGAVVRHLGVQLVNNTGSTLTQFSLSYAGEQWRAVVGEGQDKLDFSYQVFTAGAGSLGAAGYTNADTLDFLAPIFSVGGSTPLDGNAPANRALLGDTIFGLNWAPGEELWLRWSDSNPGTGAASRRSAMAVDDVSVSANFVPEPATATLGLLGLAGLMGRRRRMA
ncbi:MAG: PEP-CTERM sorting domain-containing protein [Phycisphaeraceae bacterium]